MTLRQLVIVFLALVGLIGLGIVTGFFNRGGTPGAPAPVDATQGVTPAPAPPVPATPAAAPVYVYDGETVAVLADTIVELTNGNRAGQPGAPFVRYRGREATKFTMMEDDRFKIMIDSIGWYIQGRLDPATGALTGEIGGLDRSMYSHFSGQLTRNAAGALAVQGGYCIGMSPDHPMAPSARNLGGRIWGPLDAPMPPGLPERASNLCGPDSPAAVAAGPVTREDTIANLRKNGGG
jgi:hypothetical protein